MRQNRLRRHPAPRPRMPGRIAASSLFSYSRWRLMWASARSAAYAPGRVPALFFRPLGWHFAKARARFTVSPPGRVLGVSGGSRSASSTRFFFMKVSGQSISPRTAGSPGNSAYAQIRHALPWVSRTCATPSPSRARRATLAIERGVAVSAHGRFRPKRT
jgi:hypothetical protein